MEMHLTAMFSILWWIFFFMSLTNTWYPYAMDMSVKYITTDSRHVFLYKYSLKQWQIFFKTFDQSFLSKQSEI